MNNRRIVIVKDNLKIASLTYLMDQNSCWFWDTFAKDEDFEFHAIQTNTSVFEFKDFSIYSSFVFHLMLISKFKKSWGICQFVLVCDIKIYKRSENLRSNFSLASIPPKNQRWLFGEIEAKKNCFRDFQTISYSIIKKISLN